MVGILWLLLTDSFRQDFFHFNMWARNRMYGDQFTGLYLPPAEPASVARFDCADVAAHHDGKSTWNQFFHNRPVTLADLTHGICGFNCGNQDLLFQPYLMLLLHNDLNISR